MDSILDGLRNHEFNGYPIVDGDNRLRGLISRHYLTVLLKKRCWTTASIRLRELSTERQSNQHDHEIGGVTVWTTPGAHEEVVTGSSGSNSDEKLT